MLVSVSASLFFSVALLSPWVVQFASSQTSNSTDVQNTTAAVAAPSYPPKGTGGGCGSVSTCHLFFGRLDVVVFAYPFGGPEPRANLFNILVLSNGAIVQSFPGSETGTVLILLGGKYQVSPQTVAGGVTWSPTLMGPDCDSEGNVIIRDRTTALCVIAYKGTVG